MCILGGFFFMDPQNRTKFRGLLIRAMWGKCGSSLPGFGFSCAVFSLGGGGA